MAFIAYHPAFKHTLPEDHRFPMIKYELLHGQLLYEGVAEENDFFRPELLSPEHLKGVHDEAYTQKLFQLKLSPGEIRRIGFPLTKELVERELYIAQGTITAAERAFETGIGFNIAGGTHRAGSHWGEGFCLLNDQAIAAHYLITHHTVSSVLIIDLDVHQGNGTAEIFSKEEKVFTFSMHGQNNFPFIKEKSDLDAGLPDGIGGEAYLLLLEKHLTLLFKRHPQFVFYQAGADVLATDKMGKLALSTEDCKERDRLVFSFCKRYGISVQVSMGGGYSANVNEIVQVHSHTFKEGISSLL